MPSQLFLLFALISAKSAEIKANRTFRSSIGNQPEEAEIWLAQLTEQLPDIQFTISHFGPVIGTHLGEGAMGLGWVKRRV